VTQLPLHFLNKEDLILVKLLMQRELACLSECFSTALKWAFKRPLTCVNVHVLFEVLTECEILSTSQASVLLGWHVSGFMASEGEPRCEGLITAGVCLASVWLFHV